MPHFAAVIASIQTFAFLKLRVMIPVSIKSFNQLSNGGDNFFGDRHFS